MSAAVSLQVARYQLPLRRPLQTARGPLLVREGFLVRAQRGGRIGYGESAPLPDFGTEQLDACARALAAACRGSLGAAVPPRASLSAVTQLLATDELRATPAARAGLSQALADLCAQERGVPLWSSFLEAPGSADAGPLEVSALLSTPDPLALAQEALAAVAEGFRTLKLKVGLGAQADLARARAVRAAVGPAVALRLDANGAWSLAQAQEQLGALREVSPELCEQPLAVDSDPRDWLTLRKLCRVAADESCVASAAVTALIDAGAVDAVVLKPTALGGPGPALALAAAARARGCGCLVTTSLEGSVGRAGAAHLALALRGGYACGLATGSLLSHDLGPDPLAPRAGRIERPAAPGLGVQPREGWSWS